MFVVIGLIADIIQRVLDFETGHLEVIDVNTHDILFGIQLIVQSHLGSIKI